MAEGEVKLVLDPETEQRLQIAVEAAGRSVDDHALALVVAGLFDDHWSGDVQIADEADRTGASYSADEAMSHFRAHCTRR